MPTRIEWCEETWSPMTGCSPVSEACDNCFARAMTNRFKTKWGYDFTPTFHPDRLDIPLHWRKPRAVFVGSMTDLFHEAFTDEQRFKVLGVVALSPQHTFMLLTKRPEAMRAFFRRWGPHFMDTDERSLGAKF